MNPLHPASERQICRIRPRRHRLRGQSMSEYLVILALIAGVFALPEHGGQALLVHFADAIGEGFANFLNALSIPL